MHNQQLLNEKLQQIIALQQDLMFLQRRKKEAEEKRLAEEAEKERKRAASAARSAAARKKKQLEKEMGLPPSDPRKWVKAIVKARAEQRARQLTSEEREALPARTGGPNLEGKVRVRVNERTEVWVLPGYNLQELKAKYNKP